MEKKLDEEHIVIKEAYKNMAEIIKLNEPEVYLMPVSLYNEIMKKVIYLESALKEARKSNLRLTEIKRGDNRKIVQELEAKRKYWEERYKKLRKLQNE